MKSLIKEYLPKIIMIIGEDNSRLDRLNSFEERYNSIVEKHKAEEKISIHCLIDWICIANTGDNQSISFLNFVDSQCDILYSRVNESFKTAIKNTITELLLSFDVDIELRNNPAFMNFLGEIIGLNAILDIKEINFSLERLEFNLPNGKSIDYMLVDEKGNRHLIEVLSIHNIDPCKIESEEGLQEFLRLKFNQKIETKTKDVETSDNIFLNVDGKDYQFNILPFIWTEPKTLKEYYNLFKKLDQEYGNVMPCYTISSGHDESGKWDFEFSKLSNVLEQWVGQTKSTQQNV